MLIEKIGPHILYNTQCQRGLPRLKENSINTVICDPPYGTTLLQWDTVIDFEWLWPALNRVCKNRHVLFSSQPFTSKLLVSNERAFSHEVVWEKTITGNPYLAKKMPQVLQALQTLRQQEVQDKTQSELQAAQAL